jgi:hypothetical protein
MKPLFFSEFPPEERPDFPLKVICADPFLKGEVMQHRKKLLFSITLAPMQL